MSADHSNTIEINIFLAPSPPSRIGFGTALFLVDQDAGNSLNGSRVASYAGAAEAQAANTAGYISSSTLAALIAGFSQIPTANRIKVAYRDTGASETISAALTAIDAVDTDWYGIAQYSREDADIVALSAAIETRKKIAIVQSDDASILDAGLPAGISAIDGAERTALIYHSTDAQPADLAWLTSRLVFDPDTRSAPWDGEVRGITAYTTGLTSSQRDLAIANNANLGLPFSSAGFYVSRGVNMNGRALYEIVTGDWFRARVSEDIAYLKLQHTARGEKIIVDSTGQAKILAILNARLSQGENPSTGHFPQGQTRAVGEDITLQDIQARRLRFKVEAQIAADAVNFVVNVYLQPDPLQIAA